jgi:trehalose-6-phosphate synthase
VVPSEGLGYQLIKNELQTMKVEVNKLVKEIEEEFGKGAIQYMERDLVMEERIALWGISNTLLITTLRDG